MVDAWFPCSVDNKPQKNQKDPFKMDHLGTKASLGPKDRTRTNKL